MPGAARAGRTRARARVAGRSGEAAGALTRLELARLCARVENDWVGAQTGLLDQLASLFGQRDAALCIDFATLAIEPVPLGWEAGGWSCSTPAIVTRTPAPPTTSAAPNAPAPASCLAGLAQRGACRGAWRAARAAASPRPPRARRKRARARRRAGAARRRPARARERCSTPHTRACATTSRYPRRPSRRPSRGCAKRAPPARG